MTRFRFRLTLRRLMLAIAAVGVLLGGGIFADRMVRLSREYRGIAARRQRLEAFALQNAEFYREMARRDEALLEAIERGLRNPDLPGWSRQIQMRSADLARQQRDKDRAAAVSWREIAAWSVSMHAKYDRSASRPWERIEPDPPMPPTPR